MYTLGLKRTSNTINAYGSRYEMRFYYIIRIKYMHHYLKVFPLSVGINTDAGSVYFSGWKLIVEVTCRVLVTRPITSGKVWDKSQSLPSQGITWSGWVGAQKRWPYSVSFSQEKLGGANSHSATRWMWTHWLGNAHGWQMSAMDEVEHRSRTQFRLLSSHFYYFLYTQYIWNESYFCAGYFLKP